VDNHGEFGDGKTREYSTRATKVGIPAGVKITVLANPMPFDGALAIDAHGYVWGWGLNAYGDLCLAGLAGLRPERLPLSHVTLATGARTHSPFDSNGRVYACGSGEEGVLGDNSTANSDVPVRVQLPGAARQVSQGGSGATNGQTVAILANGSVWAWGAGRRGQLGDGSAASSGVPVRVNVPAGVTFANVDSGGYACYAIDSSGVLWAWRGNENGQLGTGAGARVEPDPVDAGIHLTQVSSTSSNVGGLR
jgi:alpha-tubulin suppressor-like RCC1 family protein